MINIRNIRKIITATITVLIFLISVTGCLENNGVDNKEAKEYEGRPEMKYINAGKEIPFKDLDLNGKVITFAAWWNQEINPGESELGDLQLERKEYLENQYNCKLNFPAVNEGDIITRIQTSVEANDPIYDFAYTIASNVPMLATKGYLQDLNEMEYLDFTEEKWPKFPTTVGKFGDGVYTMDMDLIFQPRAVVLWNKTMFEKNGWPDLYELVDNNEWTFDKMLEIAQMAEDPSMDRTGIMGYAFMQTQMVFSNDGELISVDKYGKPSFAADSPNAIEALQFLMDLNYKYKVMNEPEAPTWDSYPKAFKEGKSAMVMIEAYLIKDYLTDMEDDFGLIPPPMGPKATQYVSKVGDAPMQIMSANNPKAQEAAYILDLYTEPFPGYEDAWRTNLETYLRDEESIENYYKTSNYYSKFDYSFYFRGAQALISDAINETWYGETTLGTAFSSIKTKAIEMMNDTYDGWKN